jgi:chondroitin AC lyase
MAMLVLLRLPFVLFALFAPAAAPAAVGENAGDAMVVRSHVLRELVPARPIPHVDREVAAIVPALLSNGTWSDIPYADAERSWWFAAEHLRRCLLMASAFTSPHSRHCGEASVRQASDRAFEWWLKTDPQNQWWWMQIGVPRILCKYLLMLPSSRLFSLAVPLLDRTPLSTAMSWTGCNRVWGASVHVLRGAIELNDTRLDAAFAIAHSTLKLGQQNGDGLQSDGSFHQHGPQLYSGWGYGAIYTTNMLVLERYAQDTDWTIPDLQFDLFAHLVLDGQAQSTRGANFDFLSCGRLFTCQCARHVFRVAFSICDASC